MYIKDMTGKVFGERVVIGMTHRKDAKGRAYWECKCQICGRTIEVRGDNLRIGNSKKCSYCAFNGGGRYSREII